MNISLHTLAAGIRNPVLPGAIGGSSNASGSTALGGFIGALVDLLFIISFLLAFFFLLTGAITWITSGGDKNNLENARNRIIHALMGLIVVAAAWAIMILVGKFIGIDFPKIPIPTVAGS